MLNKKAIKITKQINYNECGACVLKSLVQYHFNKNIDISQIIDDSKINSDGLSIYDLEILANKYGLELTSYEATIDELKVIDTNKIFILVVKNNNLLHYVLAKNQKNKIIIYCSEKGEYSISYDEFKDLWTGIYIECNKAIFDQKLNIIKNNYFNLFEWKYLLFINFLNIVLIIATLFGSTLFKILFNRVIQNNNINNLLSISVTFIIFYLFQFIIEWFNSLYCQKYNFKNYQILHSKTFNILNHKYHHFFNKIDFAYLLSVDTSLYEVSSFYSIKFNKFISDIIAIISTSIYLGIVNYQFTLLATSFAIIALIFESIKYVWSKNNVNRYKLNQNNYLASIDNYIKQIKINSIYNTNIFLLKQLKENHTKIKQQTFEQQIFISTITFLDNFIFSLGFIFCINVACQLIDKKNINASDLILVISLLQLNIKSIRNLSSIATEINSLKMHKQILLNIWNIENKEESGIDQIDKINLITYESKKIYNDSLIIGKSGVGKTTMLKEIANLIKTDKNILVNETNIKLINSEEINTKFFYISDESFYNKNLLFSLINTPYWLQIMKILKQMNLKDIDDMKLSKGQKQALAFISLLNFNNKVLLLDEILSNVDVELKNMLLNEIKPLLIKNNYVVMVDHNLKNKNYFNKQVLCE